MGKKDSDKKKKIIGAAAGVAAAAGAAAGIAAATLKKRGPSVYHVRKSDDGWILQREGSDDALSTHRIKRQAVKAGRKYADESQPSRLVIHRSDDSVQTAHEYGFD